MRWLMGIEPTTNGNTIRTGPQFVAVFSVLTGIGQSFPGGRLRSRSRPSLAVAHPDRIFLLELFEPGLQIGYRAVEFGQQHVLQRVSAAHRASVLERQAGEIT